MREKYQTAMPASGHPGGGLPPGVTRQKRCGKCMRQPGLFTPPPLFLIPRFASKQPIGGGRGQAVDSSRCPQLDHPQQR